MQKKITDTTATYPLGAAYQSRLFQVMSGSYQGRRVALIQTSSTEIKFAWSDAPSSGWSSMTTVASDADNQSFDAVMTEAGDIHVAYSEQTTNYLVTRKLTFSGGTWSVGSKVTIYSGTAVFDPSLAVESGGTLWVSFCRFVSPNRTVRAKSSTDGGTTWGSGAADAGDELSGSSMFAWSQCLVDDFSVHVIFNDQDTALSIRSRALSGGSWSSQYNIATGSSFSAKFHAALGADNRLGVTYYRDQLYYREYDGSNWGAVVVLGAGPVASPQLMFEGNVPAVVFMKYIGSSLTTAYYTDRRTGTFSTPEQLDATSGLLDAVLLYDASSDTYEDLTSEAASLALADVYHSSSGCAVKDEGDVLFMGKDARFRVVRLALSTVGVGGTMLVSYWDGTNWQAFTPANGATGLDASSIDLLLWTDRDAIPDDWQRSVVNSQNRYWIKLEVNSAFSTGPVASQVCAATETERMIFRRQ